MQVQLMGKVNMFEKYVRFRKGKFRLQKCSGFPKEFKRLPKKIENMERINT